MPSYSPHMLDGARASLIPEFLEDSHDVSLSNLVQLAIGLHISNKRSGLIERVSITASNM